MADYLAEKMSAIELGEAAIIAAHANRPQVLREAQAIRKHVNHADRHGMTPRLYAASIDYGTTEMVEALLQAGSRHQSSYKGRGYPARPGKAVRSLVYRDSLGESGRRRVKHTRAPSGLPCRSGSLII